MILRVCLGGRGAGFSLSSVGFEKRYRDVCFFLWCMALIKMARHG